MKCNSAYVMLQMFTFRTAQPTFGANSLRYLRKVLTRRRTLVHWRRHRLVIDRYMFPSQWLKAAQTVTQVKHMSTGNSPCPIVATGGVGESGPFSSVTHIVNGPASKIMVLRNVETSLCPNTGAGAVLMVNGVPVASGVITAAGSSIQAEAAAGATVLGVVHTIPLNNGIMCIRLGELRYALSECELERSTARGDATSFAKGSSTLPTRDWYAWNNLMPPRPDNFHIVGEVQVANPGVDVLLVPRIPQGINPRILLLELVLTQQPGLWPQMITWKQVRYDKVNITYDQVEIFFNNQNIASVPVDNIV